jgi:hypothetical protein
LDHGQAIPREANVGVLGHALDILHGRRVDGLLVKEHGLHGKTAHLAGDVDAEVEDGGAVLAS